MHHFYILNLCCSKYHRRGDQPAESGITLEQKIKHFSAHFSRFSKTIVEILVDCQKCKHLFGKFRDFGNPILGFLSAAFGTCSPWNSCFLERSELKSCRWHLSDPELIAEALKCGKMLESQGFPCFLHNVTQRRYQNIIAGSRCVKWHVWLASLACRA